MKIPFIAYLYSRFESRSIIPGNHVLLRYDLTGDIDTSWVWKRHKQIIVLIDG